MDYRLSSEAEKDLEDLFFYGYQTWGEDGAILFLQGVYERFEWLAQNPEIGPFREEEDFKEYRSWYQEPYVIFYRTFPKFISIEAVAHGKKNFLILRNE